MHTYSGQEHRICTKGQRSFCGAHRRQLRDIDHPYGYLVLVHVHRYVYMYLCMHVCAWRTVDLHMYVCMYLCMYANIYICVCVYISNETRTRILSLKSNFPHVGPNLLPHLFTVNLCCNAYPFFELWHGSCSASTQRGSQSDRQTDTSWKTGLTLPVSRAQVSKLSLIRATATRRSSTAQWSCAPPSACSSSCRETTKRTGPTTR
jgi:hypothetical protein